MQTAMRRPSNVSALLATACALVATSTSLAQSSPPAKPQPKPEDWIELFNSRDLTGWTPKISKHALGENFADTYRVENGVLQVRYDKYQSFDAQFGHLFYKTPYSYYRLAIEYRFVGEQAKGNPGAWAFRNSGVMVHSQDPRTITRDQDFPISIEAQFLGGKSDGKARPTLNMCSPGTEVVIDGSLYPEHCLNSASNTYDGDRWVRAEMLVLGAGQITHIIDGQKVLEYALPQFGGDAVHHHDPKAQPVGKLIEGGYIALQSESHPIDFRKVSLLNLAGCMDAKASNYRSYYVKSEPATCQYGRPAASP
ncbi:MAG TPA: DUF1080 domain-containing protein [Steroidobacter sp.]|uniref:3-keto-disaccharide hydrolase n=1 Tax=Steroidobacter sp. TaxID=1978227 RepID=UPI002ED85BE0